MAGLLGVTGGIAAYKACELTRLLVKQGHEVIPLVTPGAQRFVAEETFLALARRPKSEDVYQHLTRADLLVVAPCTANTLAKLAYGIADNVLTEAALAHRGPVLVAPAMNPRMWAHAATRANVETLVARGVELVGPDEGEMAEGEWGVGRLAEPDEIAARVAQLLAPGSLAGRRVLVTAGGTREPLDSVRFLGNRSSGRMGVALAEEARRRGAEVILLAANLAVPAPHGVETIPTPTAEAMLDAALALPDVDVLLLAAAVADYRPAEALAGKRPKDERGWTVELAPTDDIARLLGEQKRDGQVLVAFGAEHGDEGRERKRAMLETKNADLVVFNDVGRTDIGFDAADNEVVLMTRDGDRRRREGVEAARRRRDPRRGRKAVAVEAVVMAAGEGTRLRPLTDRWPKPVLPIDGRPVVVTLRARARVLRADRRRHRASGRAGRGARAAPAVSDRGRATAAGLGSADAVLRAPGTPAVPGARVPTPCSSRERSSGSRELRCGKRRRRSAWPGEERRAALVRRPARPRPASNPFRASRRTSCRTCSGVPPTTAPACLLSRSGATRNLTSPADVVRENFPYLR